MAGISDQIDSTTELTEAIYESLNRKGVLNQIKAKIRAEIYSTIEDKTAPAPSKPQEMYLASEIIREFMMSTKLDSSLSVFNEELGQPSEMTVDREFVGAELGFNLIDERGTDRVPLLVLLIKHLQLQKDQRDHDFNFSKDGEYDVGDLNDDDV
jgi:lisH domain-containing protein FOPNL